MSANFAFSFRSLRKRGLNKILTYKGKVLLSNAHMRRSILAKLHA